MKSYPRECLDEPYNQSEDYRHKLRAMVGNQTIYCWFCIREHCLKQEKCEYVRRQ